MHNIRTLSQDLYYIGCSDRRLSLFESRYPVPNGVSYNSYLLCDEKTVLFDTVDKSFEFQFLKNLDAGLAGRKLDYIVVHHMEPDHAALIETIVKLYPNVKVVCTQKAQTMIKQFFEFDIDSHSLIVKENDILNTGRHEFQFITAPMVHWPEVMVTYDKTTKSLFSADAFGSFGAVNGNLFDKDVDWEKDYLSEFRRYYTNIVGKYGLQVQMLLKKVSNLEVENIYPLHGLVIQKNIGLLVDKYNQWSTYTPEENGAVIIYSSVYGGTENALEILAAKLADKGVRNIKMFDISRSEVSGVLAECFKYSHIVLGTTTYNSEVFESMHSFIHTLVSHNLQNRKYVLIENGSWAATCDSFLRAEIEKLKGSQILNEKFSIKSSLKESQLAELDNVVNTIAKSLDL
jgi:flavorubredoxin